jgi:hypothetical protein
VFAGTGAIVIDETTGGAVTHVGVALTFAQAILRVAPKIGKHLRRADDPCDSERSTMNADQVRQS